MCVSVNLFHMRKYASIHRIRSKPLSQHVHLGHHVGPYTAELRLYYM